MAIRQDIPQKMIIGGAPYVITLIENPTIEDVLVSEMRIQLAAQEGRKSLLDNHVVDRSIKDFLIRLGVSQ